MTRIEATPEEWEQVPEYLRDELVAWVETGRWPVSSFLLAVLRNDFRRAVFAADDDMTLEQFRSLKRFLINCCPWGCHGSKDNCLRWQDD